MLTERQEPIGKHRKKSWKIIILQPVQIGLGQKIKIKKSPMDAKSRGNVNEE